MKVKCNNCMNEFDEDLLDLFEIESGDLSETITAIDDGYSVHRIHPKPENPFYFKGCPLCQTDAYLMDLDEI